MLGIKKTHLVIGLLVSFTLFTSGCSQKSGDSGDSAQWELTNSAEVNAQSTTLTVGVSRLGCAGGETGKVLAPTIKYDATQILIRTDVEALTGDAYSCPSNDVVPLTIELSEPVGKRELVDASCLEAEAASTSMCTDGGVRWTP